MRLLSLLATILSAFFLPSLCLAQLASQAMISQAEANRHGLKRAWMTQVSLDRASDRIANMVLSGRHLIVQTDKSLLQVLDAETGGRVWTMQVGNRAYAPSPPSANEKVIAVVNGSTLYILDRATGKTLREQRLRWVPSGTVTVAENWVYVPTLNSQLEVFGLKDPELKWNCASAGYIDQPPLVGRSALVWGTSKGYVNFASPTQGELNFRLQTNGPVCAPMSYWPPLVLAASRDGYLYAIHERSGDTVWRFSLGSAVNEAPVALDGSVFVVPEQGGLHCLAAEDGGVRWYNPKAIRILAATPTYLYAADRFGNTLILDVKTGGHVDTLLTWQFPVKYTNLANDRLYLGTSTGLLVCLRELPLTQPTQHVLPDEGLPMPAGGEPMAMPDPSAAPQAQP